MMFYPFPFYFVYYFWCFLCLLLFYFLLLLFWKPSLCVLVVVSFFVFVLFVATSLGPKPSLFGGCVLFSFVFVFVCLFFEGLRVRWGGVCFFFSSRHTKNCFAPKTHVCLLTECLPCFLLSLFSAPLLTLFLLFFLFGVIFLFGCLVFISFLSCLAVFHFFWLFSFSFCFVSCLLG